MPRATAFCSPHKVYITSLYYITVFIMKLTLFIGLHVRFAISYLTLRNSKCLSKRPLIMNKSLYLVVVYACKQNQLIFTERLANIANVLVFSSIIVTLFQSKVILHVCYFVRVTFFLQFLGHRYYKFYDLVPRHQVIYNIACVAGGIRGYKGGSLKYRLPKN